MLNTLRTTALAALALAALATASPATEAWPAPTGDVILTVTGGVEAAPIEIDRATLSALPQVTIRTSTIWTEGEQEFTGVELATLLDRLGVDGGTVHAVAVNDYAVDIPVAEIAPGGAVLAHSQNGAPMSLRDRGPLWIVYPYDAAPEFRTEVVYARSIWQLDRIDIRD